jgi:Tfp pilus assembly protein PilW
MREFPHRGDDSGYTLAELIVAMGMASILLVAIGTIFNATTSGVRTLNTQVSTVADGRIAMEAMIRSMRVAAIPPGTVNETIAVKTATRNSVSFFALLNRTGSAATTTPNPTLVSYSWSSATNCINESRTPQRTAANGDVIWDQNTTTTCLARTTQAPVFAYYINGSTSTPITIPSSGSLTATNRTTVRSIQMSLTIKDPRNPSVKPIQLTDRVTLTNVPAPS